MHTCTYCHRGFQFQDLYERHFHWCEFLWKGNRERAREQEALETHIPSQHEQFYLLQSLLIKTAKLEKEVGQLRNTVAVRKRVAILGYLEKARHLVPHHTFYEWLGMIAIGEDDLHTVFRNDLVEGMKKVLLRAMVQDGALPVCAFTQKRDTFYIYIRDDDGEVKWTTMQGEHWERGCNRLAHRFLQEFLKWQSANTTERMTTQMKEQHVEYMRKINGLGDSYEDRRRREWKKEWFGRLAKDIVVECEFY